MMSDIQLMLNSCVRRNIVFDYNGKRCVASLNLTLNCMNSLRCECRDVSESDVLQIDNYLKEEGFFD